MASRGTVACVRCGENLVDAKRPCGFCVEERRRSAVSTLIAAAKSTSNASLLARLEAIETLRSCGFTDRQVLQARARALDGHSTEQVLELLAGPDLRKQNATKERAYA